MTDRAKQIALGLLFWIAFSIPAVICIALLPLGILFFALDIGNLRPWVYRSGKALDQLNNAAWFGGLPQETISSHAGRYVESGKPMPLMFRFVVWLTNLFEENHAVKAIEDPFKGESL